ncbi:MAG: hypothetical protein JEY94_00415 [Melioribacteraceae bacterium]|nr:hypothetical protein [Melioribacteraceae bacterium]
MPQNYAAINNKTMCTGYNIKQEGENTVIKFTFNSCGKELNGEFLGILDATLEKGITRIIVDLSSCEFPNFKIWGDLFEFYKRLEKKGGKLCLIWNPKFKLTLYNITKFSRLFKIYPDLNSAIRHLN